MFGYRLIREADWAALHADLAAVRAEGRAAQDQYTGALVQLAGARASAESRATANDHLTMQLNTAMLERAQLMARVTGMPAVAPQIGTGNPLSAEGIGAGVDLFEDVGDAKALELEKRGLLAHTPGTAFPSAAALVPGAE